MKQSFNAINFIKIYFDENRKGVYLDGRFLEFKKLQQIAKSIKLINKKFKNGRLTTDAQKEQANKIKELLQKKKFEKLTSVLQIVEQKIEAKDYTVTMLTKIVRGKTVYTIDRTNIVVFFILKQIQKNIENSFKVKQSDRNEIIGQVINMIDNSFPKYIIRTDIASFYESIPHDKLKDVINRNYILNNTSKRIIYEILRQYTMLTGLEKGIPRGIGISAYLAELYMRDFDTSMKNLSNTTYYTRYVDDIILIFTPDTKYDNINYKEKVNEKLESFGLTMNVSKTKEINLFIPNNYNFEFLGYRFDFSNKLNIDISNSKKLRYKQKMELAFDDYNKESKYNEKKSRKLLIKRLSYLTGNTRLLGVKKDILIGMYFSNQQIIDMKTLSNLDNVLRYSMINSKLTPYSKLTYINLANLKMKLNKFSFVDGFQNKKFYKFTRNDLEEILKIWKTI